MIVFPIFTDIGGISTVFVDGEDAFTPSYERLQSRSQCLKHQ